MCKATRTRNAVALRHFSSMGRKEDPPSIDQISFKKKPNFDTIISTEIISEELKPVVSSNFEFEKWWNLKIKLTYSRFRFINIST